MAFRKRVDCEVALGQRALGRGGPLHRAAPTPATHVILAQLKAGETVYQAGELPKTRRVSKIDHEPPKTVCKTTFASIFPPSMESGDGTRRLCTGWRRHVEGRRVLELGAGLGVPGMARPALWLESIGSHRTLGDGCNTSQTRPGSRESHENPSVLIIFARKCLNLHAFSVDFPSVPTFQHRRRSIAPTPQSSVQA